MQEPVPWHKVLLAPMVAIPLGVTIALLDSARRLLL